MNYENMYKINILTNFYDIYNTNKNELLDNSHIYFRYMCFKYINFIRYIELPNFKTVSEYESVLIEYRCFPHLEFLIRNAIIKLGNNWSHTIICGNMNYEYMTNMCNNISRKIKVIKTNYDNLVPSEYSKLLTSLEFWNFFEGEKILIYQEDTCIFKSNIDDFIEWDYIGAPFNKKQNDTPNSVGNGGFSLRTKNIMKKIINFISVNHTNFNYSTTEYMKRCNLDYPPEDVYFSKNMQEFNIGRVADWDSAYLFSTEGIYNPTSFAGHKFWLSNKNWKLLMKSLYNLHTYTFGNDIKKYLTFTNKDMNLDLTLKIKNAFDVDLFFCNNVNNLKLNENQILKYVKESGLNGKIYHPKQIENIYNDISFFKFSNEIFISYKLNIYPANTFVNEFIYNKSYDDIKKLIIKKIYEKIDDNESLLLLVFIGNESVGIDLLNKIIKYKKIQTFNISFCFNSNTICKKFKDLIKNNFKNYYIYISKDLGTDITPTLLMYDDISKFKKYKHIIKLHTKSITNSYNELTDYLLSVPLYKILSKKSDISNCIGHDNYYINLQDDIFNKVLLVNNLLNIDITKTFVGGTIFYSESVVFDAVINFIIQNNYMSYLLNNMYENNLINLDFSPIHFLERLFGVIRL